MTNPRARWMRLVVALLITALIAGACGDDDSPASAGGTTTSEGGSGSNGDGDGDGDTTPTTRDPNAPNDTVTLSAVARANAGNWFVVAGMNEGIYDKYGIDVDIVTNPGSLPAIAGLLGGAGDLAPPTFDAGLQAQLQAPELKWVATGYNITPFELIGGEGITSVEQLQGATCAVQSLTAVDGLYARLMLADAAGFEIDEDYELISMGTTGIAARSAALESGQAQCVAAIAPETKALNDMGYQTLVRGMEGPSFENLAFFGYLGDSASYNDDPAQRDRLVRFLAATMESIVWLYQPENKEAALEILSREAGMELDVAESAYAWVEYGGYRADLRVLPEELDKVVEVAQTVDVLTLFNQDASNFIDMSLAEDAFELLDPEMQEQVEELTARFNS